MTTTTAPQLSLSRIFSAPRALVYKAFTDPEQFAMWWGPTGNLVPRDRVEFDLRPGGFMRWTELFPDEPSIWTRGRIDLTEIVEGAVIDGVMRITGNLPGDFKPFETRMRVEFHDEPDGRTRLEVQQWMPEGLGLEGATKNGWGEAFAKLDRTLVS